MRPYHLKLGFIKRAQMIMLAVLIIIIISAWTYASLTIPAGPYKLIYPANFGNRFTIPADNQLSQQSVYLGRMLFYEPRLSATNTISCSSCHEQAKAFTDGRPLSIGVRHTFTNRNSMSLANLLWTRKFFWDGRAASLEEQASIPMVNPVEMGQTLEVSAEKLNLDQQYKAVFKAVYGDETVTGDKIVKAIAQFERTLISAGSPYDQYLAGHYQPTTDEMAGMVLFNQSPDPEKGIRGGNCGRCHGGVKSYMELFHNNGIDSLPKDRGIGNISGFASDRGRFKVPTLRNIALTAPYMHDGRFATLDEVLDHYSEHVLKSASLSSVMRGQSNAKGSVSLKLSIKEKKQIIAFLNMLTDTAFVNNPQFSNPHLLTKNTRSN